MSKRINKWSSKRKFNMTCLGIAMVGLMVAYASEFLR